jgi:hypothetical protein
MKAQDMSFDMSWAIGMLFFHMILSTNYLQVIRSYILPVSRWRRVDATSPLYDDNDNEVWRTTVNEYNEQQRVRGDGHDDELQVEGMTNVKGTTNVFAQVRFYIFLSYYKCTNDVREPQVLVLQRTQATRRPTQANDNL